MRWQPLNCLSDSAAAEERQWDQIFSSSLIRTPPVQNLKICRGDLESVRQILLWGSEVKLLGFTLALKWPRLLQSQILHWGAKKLFPISKDAESAFFRVKIPLSSTNSFRLASKHMMYCHALNWTSQTLTWPIFSISTPSCESVAYCVRLCLPFSDLLTSASPLDSPLLGSCSSSCSPWGWKPCLPTNCSNGHRLHCNPAVEVYFDVQCISFRWNVTLGCCLHLSKAVKCIVQPSGNIKLKKSTVETLVTSCPARWEPNIALGNTLHPLHYSSFNFSSGWNINVTVTLVELKRSTRANIWSGYLGPITRAGVAAPTWRLPSNGVRRACVPTFQLSDGSMMRKNQVCARLIRWFICWGAFRTKTCIMYMGDPTAKGDLQGLQHTSSLDSVFNNISCNCCCTLPVSPLCLSAPAPVGKGGRLIIIGGWRWHWLHTDKNDADYTSVKQRNGINYTRVEPRPGWHPSITRLHDY